MKILVTGAAGFIGMHTVQKLQAAGHSIIGIDNLNDYYAISLKMARLEHIQAQGIQFVRMDINDYSALSTLFAQEKFTHVIHLAAQAGVRYSLTHPRTYAENNLLGTTNILELCRHHHIAHLLLASSSSVYGQNTKVPFHEQDPVEQPVSFYAATKRANELMAYSYSHLYQLPITALRFFTVYGPWGRPDMAPWLFTEAIFHGQTIRVFNHGELARDFTYVEDIVDAVVKLLPLSPELPVPNRIVNIGNHQPVKLMTFIDTLEHIIGKSACKNMVDMQPGDVSMTYADTTLLQQLTGFAPRTTLTEGLTRFVEWYRQYHQLS
jgi:UDP-glucuronate 4-epimerase